MRGLLFSKQKWIMPIRTWGDVCTRGGQVFFQYFTVLVSVIFARDPKRVLSPSALLWVSHVEGDYLRVRTTTTVTNAKHGICGGSGGDNFVFLKINPGRCSTICSMITVCTNLSCAHWQLMQQIWIRHICSIWSVSYWVDYVVFCKQFPLSQNKKFLSVPNWPNGNRG